MISLAVSLSETWINFLAKNLGDTDVINPAYRKPWFLEPTAEATFIDALYPGGEPVFLGVPATATIEAGGPEPEGGPLVSTKSSVLLPTLALTSIEFTLVTVLP